MEELDLLVAGWVNEIGEALEAFERGDDFESIALAGEWSQKCQLYKDLLGEKGSEALDEETLALGRVVDFLRAGEESISDDSFSRRI